MIVGMIVIMMVKGLKGWHKVNLYPQVNKYPQSKRASLALLSNVDMI